jgi:hypothetical protein
MLIGSKQGLKQYENITSLGLYIDDTPLPYCCSYKYLGVEIENTLSWTLEAMNICKTQIQISTVQSHIDYCLTVWGQTTSENISSVQLLKTELPVLFPKTWLWYS